jgi:uncharacterized protein (UPF0261 family)
MLVDAIANVMREADIFCLLSVEDMSSRVRICRVILRYATNRLPTLPCSGGMKPRRISAGLIRHGSVCHR